MTLSITTDNIYVCDITTSFFVLCILGITWLTIKIYTIFDYWKDKSVYTKKAHFPFGNAKDVVLQRIPLGFDITTLYNDLKRRSEKYGGYYLFLTPVFIPVDLDLIKKILISNSDCFVNRISYVDEKNDPISANVLYSRGEKWKKMRTKISPSFTNSKMKTFFPLLMKKVDDLIRLIEETTQNSQPLNVKETLDRYTIDVIGLYICATDFNTMKAEDSKLQRQLTDFFDTSVINSLIRFLITSPKILKYFKIRIVKKSITKFFIELTNQMIEHRRTRESQATDVVLDVLAQPQTKGISDFASNEVAANIAVLFLAGYDTTSNALTFCLYELANNEHLQEILRSEINTLDSNPSYDAIASLSLLNKCVYETLRKYPLTTITTRECTKTFHVPESNIILEKGAHVYIPIRGIHWDPEYFPDPEKFDPERFSQERVSELHPCSWLPFGLGPRHCVGYRLGIMNMKITLVALLRNYKFSLHPRTRSPLRYEANAFLLQAEDGVFLNVAKI